MHGLLLDPEPPVPAPVNAGEYVPPKPVRQVQPVLPYNVKSMVISRARVQVRLSIDERGKVVSAIPLASDQASGSLLTAAALTAARLWRFEPARRNTHAVASEFMVTFDFVPASQR